MNITLEEWQEVMAEEVKFLEEQRQKEEEEKKASPLLKHKNTIGNFEKIDEGALDICHRRYNFNLFINIIVSIFPIGLIFLAVMIWNHLDLWDLWGWWFAVIVILLCLISFLIALRSDQFIFTRKKVTQELISYYEQKINNEKIGPQLKKGLRTAINSFCDEIVIHYCRNSEISYVYSNKSNNSYYLRDAYINLLFEQIVNKIQNYGSLQL